MKTQSENTNIESQVQRQYHSAVLADNYCERIGLWTISVQSLVALFEPYNGASLVMAVG
jgi:hypothetical protein